MTCQAARSFACCMCMFSVQRGKCLYIDKAWRAEGGGQETCQSRVVLLAEGFSIALGSTELENRFTWCQCFRRKSCTAIACGMW